VSFLKLKTSVLPFASGLLLAALTILPAQAQPPTAAELSWLHKTAVVDHNLCPAAPGSLYRAVSASFFPLARVVRNMAGDELAEHPAWRLSAIIKQNYGDMPTLDQYRLAKNQAATELSKKLIKVKADYGNICGFATVSALATGYDKFDKSGSLGIAAADTFTGAYNYAGANAVVLKMDEKVGRATGAPGTFKGEYYFPLVIPARDITAAWSTYFSLRKVENGGELQEIDIYDYSTEPDKGRPHAQSEPTRPVGRILPCPPSGTCTSEPLAVDAPDLRAIVAALGDLQNSGIRLYYSRK
jgi:hypothetical protein